MNHALNAKLHRLPECPECDALALLPCTEHNRPREPHRVRLRIAAGDLFIVSRTVAKAKGKVRILTELVAAFAVRSTKKTTS